MLCRNKQEKTALAHRRMLAARNAMASDAYDFAPLACVELGGARCRCQSLLAAQPSLGLLA